MPAQFPYPDQLSLSDRVLQMAVLVAAITVYVLPLIREICRSGPMNWRDGVMGFVCLGAALCLPQIIAMQAVARLRTESPLEPYFAQQIWSTTTWHWVSGLMGFAVLVHGGWLLFSFMPSHKLLRTTAVYLLPFSTCCFPPLGHPRYVSHLTWCRNQAKLVLLAMYNDNDQRGGMVPSVLDVDLAPRSWRVELLPYLDQAPLRNNYDVTQPWDAAPNAAFTKMKIEPWICPANYRPRDVAGRYFTAFAGVIGPNTFFAEGGKSRQLKDCTDGTSQTLAFVEACGANIVWSEPRDLHLSEIEIGVNRPGRTRGTSRGLISSCHPYTRGGHVGMADGSVRFLSEDADPKLLEALLTINGGEPVSPGKNGEFHGK
ncbi:MAG TPA: DUF1559 domain-containing protein [Planctomycetaceae bacterium]|nr:DUF1559 domain-containing protein [Planctomycetaceae bacterium]